ncbi:MAG: cytochrome C assembly family protein, partial [Morganella morganii]
MPEISVVAISAYLLSLVLLMPGVLRYQRGYRKLALIFAVIALVCHGVAIKSQIFQGAGQNLTLLNLGSVVSLLVSVIMTIVAFQGRAWFLIPIVYSFSMVN